MKKTFWKERKTNTKKKKKRKEERKETELKQKGGRILEVLNVKISKIDEQEN